MTMMPINPVNHRPPDGRDMAGRFASGPGNVGRRPGSKNSISRNTLQAVQGLSDLAVARLRERIEAGDMAAIKLCLEYTLPRTGRTVELDGTDPTSVADALASGQISPDEAARVASTLSALQNMGEVEDLRKRLDELETAFAKVVP